MRAIRDAVAAGDDPALRGRPVLVGGGDRLLVLHRQRVRRFFELALFLHLLEIEVVAGEVALVCPEDEQDDEDERGAQDGLQSRARVFTQGTSEEGEQRAHCRLLFRRRALQAIKSGPGTYPVGVTLAIQDDQAVGEGSRRDSKTRSVSVGFRTGQTRRHSDRAQPGGAA